jgi:flagellar basal-body rod modification protein FlgD
MTAVSGIWNHAAAAGNPLMDLKAMNSSTGSTGSTDSSGSDASTISANDFLTLLVTEMQNQDPTAQTDPNEYINQLVQVNSLEQLIDINQNLSTALGTSATGGMSGRVAGSAETPGASAPVEPSNRVAQSDASASPAARPPVPQSHSSIVQVGPKTAFGNLSVPEAAPAAQRVAQALSGRN